MLFNFHLFREEGDAGGTGDSKGDDAGVQPDPKPEVVEPDTIDGWKEFHAAEQTKFSETLEAKDLELKTAKKNLGDQGNQIGDYNKIKNAIQSDPRGLIEGLIKENKLSVKLVDAEATDWNQLLDDALNKEGDPKAARADLMNAIEARNQQQIQQSLQPVVNKLIDKELSDRYEGYADLAERREETSALIKAQAIHPNEALHLATIGRMAPQMVEAADKAGFDRGAKEKEAEITKKLEEYGGSGAFSVNRGPVKEETEKTASAIKLLQAHRR